MVKKNGCLEKNREEETSGENYKMVNFLFFFLGEGGSVLLVGRRVESKGSGG